MKMLNIQNQLKHAYLVYGRDANIKHHIVHNTVANIKKISEPKHLHGLFNHANLKIKYINNY